VLGIARAVIGARPRGSNTTRAWAIFVFRQYVIAPSGFG
jgi:hypothetical protein